MRYILLVLSLLPLYVSAQDSLRVLTPETFLEWVGSYHPVAQQAALRTEQAAATLRRARGGFDPKLYGELDQKLFKGSEYYRYVDGGVKVPTRLGGLEVKAGYEQAQGLYLNPDAITPSPGLVYAGVSMPLAQGLVIDARRAALQQARIFEDAAEAERRLLLNDLYFEAIKAYWEWSLAYGQVGILDRAVEVARVRFEAMRKSFYFGDKPGVDTLEARIQLQTRLIDQQVARLQYQQAILALEVYLWDESSNPMLLDPATRPIPIQRLTAQSPDPDSLLRMVEALPMQHPALLQYRFQIASLEVERRLKAEKLKPKVQVNYNLLQTAAPASNGEAWVNPALFSNNYKWGLSVGFPIFLREARGDVELARLKIRETGLKQDLKQLELTNKLEAYAAESDILETQIDLTAENVRQYRDLFQAEIRKFETGESSLFLLNARENKLIEAELKLIELRTKYAKSLAGITWSAGLW
ncbi:MAG: TolC family protein [Bacteroidia bacterium]